MKWQKPEWHLSAWRHFCLVTHVLGFRLFLISSKKQLFWRTCGGSLPHPVRAAWKHLKQHRVRSKPWSSCLDSKCLFFSSYLNMFCVCCDVFFFKWSPIKLFSPLKTEQTFCSSYFHFLYFIFFTFSFLKNNVLVKLHSVLIRKALLLIKNSCIHGLKFMWDVHEPFVNPWFRFIISAGLDQ